MNIFTNLSILILIFLHYLKSQKDGGGANPPPETKYTLSLSNLYPSHTQLDIIYDSKTGLTLNCPENCIKCIINNNNLVICVICSYGYALYLENICVKCPNDCVNECSMHSYIDKNIWGVYPYCYSNFKAYYLENNIYMECSKNCHLCHSSTDCEECLYAETLILKYNGPNNFSCENCIDIIPGCSNCNIYSNKKKRNILYSDLKIYKNLEEYNNDECEIICLSCNQNYLYDETTKSCLTCSSIIPDCISCEQGEGIVKIICKSCSSGKIPFYDKLLNKIVCTTCSEIIPYCSNCKYGLYLNETFNFIDSSSSMFIDLYLSNSNYTMRCIECKTNYGTDLELIKCQSCPLNCEFCYLIAANMFCGRCSIGYVLSIYEGICYLISYYTNLTSASIKTYCSKIVSENPWVANISSTSNPFLCQECKDSAEYPSISGICDKCGNKTCSSCIESSSLPENLSSIAYTKLLKTQPYNLIGKIDSGTIVSSFQRCLTCNNDSFALNSKFQVCCTPNTVISLNPKISYIDKCLTCKSCDIISSIIACDVCSNCIDTQFINNDMTVNLSSVGSSLFQKKIYLFLKENPNVIQTTNPTQTYSYLYGNLTYQKNIDFASKFIMKCSACPINSVNCDYDGKISTSKLADTYKKFFSDFNPAIKDFTEVFSYFTSTKECKPNFVYDYSYKRCKFCPNDWKSCKSYKKIEINFVGDSKSINDAFTVKTINNLVNLLKNIYSSEFLFIANEFMVETIEIIVNLDNNEELSFHDEDHYELKFVGLFDSLIPSLTTHKITFQPNELSTNSSARSTINLGCFLEFLDYTEINFVNIDIRGYTNYFTISYRSSEMKSFGISINTIGPGTSGNILNCKLFGMNVNKILVDNYLKEEVNAYVANDNFLILCNLISFNFNGNTNIINLEINEFYTIDYSALSKINKIFDNLKLNGLFVFDTKSDINITNLIIKNSKFKNGLTIFHIFPGVNNFNFINIEIENCYFELTNFINHKSFNFNVSHMTINNSIVNQSNIIISQNGIKCYITVMKIIDVQFYGDSLNFILNIVFSFKIVQFKDVIINKSYFSYSQIFDFPVIITLKEDEYGLIFKNILIENNTFTPYDSDSALLFSLEYISSSLYNLRIENFSIINNKNVISYKESQLSINLTFYCFRITNVMIVYLKEIIFKNNYGFSGFYCDAITYSIEITDLKFLNDEIISVLQTPLYLSDILGICSLDLLFIKNIITNKDLIRISNSISSYVVSGKYYLTFSNSTINNIILYVPDVSTGSPFYLTSKIPMEIEIFNCNFFNNILYDDSQYEGSTSGISIDSPISTLIMSNCNFINLRSTGKYNVFKGFLFNATILFCNFSFGNFYDKSNASLIIENKIIALGTFINCLAKYINIVSCSFKNGYALYGGAIYYAQLNKISFLNINKCYFYNIYSFGDGGVIYLSTSNDKLLHIEITKSNFEYIGGFGNGGVIFSKMLNKAELKIIESNFTRFMAIQGSLIYSDQTNISMENNIISYNYNVILSETILFFDVHPYLKFPEDINIATLFQITKSSIRFSHLTIENLVSSNYLSEKGVTVLSCISSNFEDINSTYKNISFLVSVISVIEAGYISINNSKFLNNYFRSNSKMVLFQEHYISFSFNTQIEGLIYVFISEFLLENTLFENNKCIQCSKGIILNSQSSIGSINDCIFKNNSFASGGSINFVGFNTINNGSI